MSDETDRDQHFRESGSEQDRPTEDQPTEDQPAEEETVDPSAGTRRPIDPQGRTPEQWFQMALDLHQNGHLVEAEEIYRKLLQFCPGHPDVQHYLGVLCHQLGRSEEALTLMRQALATVPDQPDYHANLGPVLIHLNRLVEAEHACRAALRLQPGNLSARNNLGIVLKRTNRLAEAEQEFRWILGYVPKHADALCNLMTVLERQDKFDEAAEVAAKALELKAREGPYYENLSRTLRKAGKPEQAIEVLREWLRFDPDNPIARHNLHALLGDNAAPRCTAAYVQQTFDDFAPEFDQVLQTLDYAGPDVLKQELQQRLSPPDQQLRILDAGCGTGLAAPVLRPYARRLVGVDLSPKMLAIAQSRDSYHELIPADLTEYLAGSREMFELIVSLDTLLYFGDLAEVLSQAANRLEPNGWLVFSTEKMTDPLQAPGYRLQPTGRYCHHVSYLDPVITQAGLERVAINDCVLRKECSRPVASLFVTARKPPT